jgi:hypothetical protein
MKLETVGRFLAGPLVAWLGSGLLTRPLVYDPTGTTTGVAVTGSMVVVGIPLGVAFAQRRLYLKRTAWFVFVANFAAFAVLLAVGVGLRLLAVGFGWGAFGAAFDLFSSLRWRLFGFALNVLTTVATYRLLFDEEETLRVREEPQSS